MDDRLRADIEDYIRNYLEIAIDTRDSSNIVSERREIKVSLILNGKVISDSAIEIKV